MSILPRFAALGFGLLALAACQPRGQEDPAIFASVRNNDTAALSSYLEGGGSINVTSVQGDPLVYVASGPKGGVEVLAMLLNAGASPDAKSGEGRTLLQNAASWCDANTVSVLLRAGADPNLPGKGGVRPANAVCSSPADLREATLALIFAAGGMPN